MKVGSSRYLMEKKPVFKKLLDQLLARYSYASVIASDVVSKNYNISGRGINIGEQNGFGKRAFTVRVYDNGGYAEYSSVTITEDDFESVLKTIEESLKASRAYNRMATPVSDDEKLAFCKSTDYEIDPVELGDEAIINRLAQLREKGKAMDERIMDVTCRFNFQRYHKIFLSKNRDLEQNVLFTDAAVVMMARKGAEIKTSYKSCSCLGGAEVLDQVESFLPITKNTVIDLLSAEPLTPGEYDCICSPSVTGMIVHEAFGHGVEMDMFVKDRALAKQYVGKRVASDLITMRDGACTGYDDVATFFFDDEGTVAHDTLVIDKGILVSGYADEVSAKRLGVEATGNGRRESVDHKAYTRMTNTYFVEGNDELDDMIASIKDGLLLDEPSSGMEDPKNWGIQCMVSFGREIKDGKLTGRIFSPIVLSGYVPDLLQSISMVGKTVEHAGSGFCGKGHKEWVKVSDGGPYIKARIRLG
ncbi:MAG: TldD/PmbA family protein [Sphaerochaetaceae bacterium]|nr:TldD/PmbA family protein [Sphaerochaetaceae bacterium]